MQDIYTSFEFNKIKDSLLEYAKSEIAKENISNLVMFSSLEEVSRSLEELKEMSSIIYRFGPLPISTSANALYIIDLAKKTSLLTPRDLNLIKEDIATSKKIVAFLNKIGLDYKLILDKTSKFFDLTSLEKEIARVITNSLTIADNATPELNEIRHNIRKLEKQLEQKIASISFKYSQYLSDDNPTIRDGHFVLPVKTNDKSHVFGIVYDVSNSGATTFIEPMEVVEINNSLTSLKVEESEECRKILKMLTSLCLIQEHEIIVNNQIIGELDFLSAKALYAKEINAEIALLSKEPFLDLVDARHPLIDPNKVVSNSYHLDQEKRIIIISGPNAGGKTVSLKVVGTLVLMNQCGLAIPISKATLSYFNNIYIDIGDNQSLSDNLSTFSAHMSQIGEILKAVKGKDLFLLDELGTGTDPKEGEALALSVLKYLESKNAFGIISSHFEALKEYAFLSPNIENASMIFDEENLSPTYRFRQGAPGHSYALDVANRYGIDENLIKEARKFLESQNDSHSSELLDILQKKIEENSKLEYDLARRKKEIEAQEKKLANDEANLKSRRDNLLSDVESTKEKMLSDAQEEIDEILAKLNKDNIKMHEVIELKKELDDLKTRPEEITYDEDVQVGDYVSIPSLNMSGVVDRIKGNKAHVTSDSNMSFDVEINKLHKTTKPKSNNKQKSSINYEGLIKTNVGLELNIIGLYAEEAKAELITYLDNCRLKHLKQVRIIHGFGSGALRKMVRAYLDTQKDLTYRAGNEMEGAGGATVVIFK